MTRRWDTETHVVDVAAPTNKIVMTQTGQATGDLNSQHRVTEHPAGFRIRERGALDGYVVHQYRCPVHGVFDAKVMRDDVPDELACGMDDGPAPLHEWGPWKRNPDGTEIWCNEHGVECRVRGNNLVCGLTAPWAGSLCGQGWSSGECKS